MGRHLGSSTPYLADTFNPHSRSHCCPCLLPRNPGSFLGYVTQAGDLVFPSVKGINISWDCPKGSVKHYQGLGQGPASRGWFSQLV